MQKTTAYGWLVIVAMMILAYFFINAFIKIAHDPGVPFLISEGGAEWIRIERPVSLAARQGNETVSYRRVFTLEREIPEALLVVRALRTASVYFDGQAILPFGRIEDWKIPRTVSLKGYLTPGVHELRITVINRNGPAILLAHSKALDLFTGKNWHASLDGSFWRPVLTVAEKKPVELSQRFPDTFSALGSLLYVYLPFFLLCLAAILLIRPALERHGMLRKLLADPPSVRWLLAGLWILLAVNNITKIPLTVGFDHWAHYEYITYIAEKWTLPLANEGWQMFQPPVFYLIAALLSKLLSLFASPEAVTVLLRIIPLACGALQVELAYRASRYVFPTRNDLQMIAMLIGGFMPMNLYISQVVGNEPLAGVFTGMAIVMALRMLRPESGVLSTGRLFLLGATAGLALLTKFTAVLIIPAIMLALIHAMLTRDEPARRIAVKISIFIGAVALVSGWFYLRNWIELGKPFVGGWDPAIGVTWWQDPGFRTIGDFISFGPALIHPILAAVNGFWDSIYSTFWLDGSLSAIIGYNARPPWNYEFMLTSALFSLIPAAGILIGFVATVSKPKIARPGEVFAAYGIAVYFAALLFLYVTLPIYSTAKATYTIGLLPCYAVLGVKGLDLVSGNRYTQAIAYACIICWAANGYVSFFVR